MSVWSEVFLGVIAVSTLAMAIAQVGVFIAASLLARRVGRLAVAMAREMGLSEDYLATVIAIEPAWA